MTRRERMATRLARREEWAAGRDRKAAAAEQRVHRLADHIPLGQPIVVGHHSEGWARRDQARIQAAGEQAYESRAMAEQHRSKAAGIERQLDRSIFSDDPDAPERLAERIVHLEATRETMKRTNAAYKAGGIEAVRAQCGEVQAVECARTLARCHWQTTPFPPYALTNVGANIRRLKGRIEEIARQGREQAAAEGASGGVLVTGTDDFINVRFAEKPERSILDALRAAGFAWAGGTWGGFRSRLPEGFLAALQDGTS